MDCEDQPLNTVSITNSGVRENAPVSVAERIARLRDLVEYGATDSERDAAPHRLDRTPTPPLTIVRCGHKRRSCGSCRRADIVVCARLPP